MRARALLAHACLKAAPHRGLSLVSADGASPSQSAPFRRFRQFFYFAAGGSASLGTLIAGARVVAGLNGVPGTQPLSETVPNTAINAGVVAVSLGLYLWEEGRGQATMKTM